MRKKILFIQQNLQGGGAEKVLLDLLNNFDYSKYEVELIVLHRYGVYVGNINPNVKVSYLMGAEYPRLLASLKSRNYHFFPRLYLQYLLKKNIVKKYDVIISFMEGVSTVAHNMIRSRGAKNISWVHTDLVKNNWCTQSFKTDDEQKVIYELMDDIVFVSDEAKTAFQTKFGITKGHVIYNVIDSKNIREKADEYNININGTITVVTVGRLVPVKNQFLLIQAAKILKDQGVHAKYWIVGEGQEREKLEGLVKEYELAEDVKLMGFHSNPYPYIKSADIFVLSSVSEGFPLVVCEAMCLGKPIVSTRTTGPSELLQNGVGVLCNHDANDFAEKLGKLIEDEQLRKSYSQAALKASENFSVKKTMEKVFAIL